MRFRPWRRLARRCLMCSRFSARHQSGRSRTPTRKILSMRFGPWRRLARRCVISSMSDVEVLCRASARKESDFNPQGLVNAFWTMVKTRTQMPDVFEVACRASARKEQDSNAQDLANSLWTIAKTRMQMLDVFEVPCRVATFPIWPTRSGPIWHCALQRLSQPSEAAIGYLNLPRWLSQRFWVQRGVCGSIPASVQSKGKGVWLFPPLGSPAFPSGVGPLMSLIPVKAIRAVGVCVVDTGPAGSDGFSERPQLCQPRLCQRCREGEH